MLYNLFQKINLQNILNNLNEIYNDIHGKTQRNEENKDICIDINTTEDEKKENNKQIEDDNIYSCLFRIKDIVRQITKYISKFEDKSIESNISILSNMDNFTTIFAMIINKMKIDNIKI